MIIDTHAHIHPGRDGLGAKQDASLEAFLAELDRSPLDLAVLLPIEPIIPNTFVFEAAQRRPGRIRCHGSVDPKRGEACWEHFEQLAAEHPIVGLKLHPRRQGITKAHWPVLKGLTQRAAAHDLPVLVDSFPHGKGALRDDSLELIEALSEAVPKAKLIIAHMGGIRILEALILARTSYRIYLDLSLILKVYKGSHIEQDIFYAIRRIGADRCLYGSDHPDVPLNESYESMRRELDGRGFTDSEQDWIFGLTAQQVLKLNGEGAE